MKLKTSSLSLLVAAGLLSTSASAAIVHLDLNFPNVYSSGESASHYGTIFTSTLDVRFNFIDGSFVSQQYQQGLWIVSNYYEDTTPGWARAIQVQNKVSAYYNGTEILGVVSSGATINASLTPDSYGWVAGYSYRLEGTNFEETDSYGLSGAGNYILALKAGYNYYGYASLSIPNIGGKMYITDVVFNDVANQGIIAGQATAAPDAPPVPEPSTYGLIGIAALGVAFAARRRKAKVA